MAKSDNMLAILWLLRSGRKWTAKQLAEELETSVRTVYRCIDSLCASGAPIIADAGPNGGYRILGRFADAPLLFDMDEQKALIQAAAFARDSGYPHEEALDRAIAKLKRYTNEAQLETLERHGGGLSVIHPKVDGRQQAILRVLEEAAAAGRTVDMTYDKGKGAPPVNRAFDPYGILYWKGAWYAVGYCGLRQERRSFRVDRIAALHPTDRRFERPADFSAKQFLLSQLLPGTLDAEDLIDVRIRGPEQALNDLCLHWMFSHALVRRGEGEADFRIGRSALLTYVPYYLLPYGKALTIAEPAFLSGRLAEIAAGITMHYETMFRTFENQEEEGAAR